MWHKLLRDSSFFDRLRRLDAETVVEVKAAGCRHCGGPLDHASYVRKLRGLPEGAAGDSRRPSLCCRLDGCRRRETPPLLLFLGRRVYMSVVVVLVAAMMNGATPSRMTELRQRSGVSARTIRRWLSWWRTDFLASAAWRRLRGRVAMAPREDALPQSLLDAVSAATPEATLLKVLRLLAA